MFPPPPYPGPMRLFGGLNTINNNNNNNVNYYDPFIFNPNALKFNVVHQVQQEVGQQPNNVGSASRVKPPRMLWTDELHRKFVDVVHKYGGPWGKATSKKELIQDVQEQLKNVDGWKADDDVIVPQLPTEEEMVEAHISPDNVFMEELLNWI
ncbi:hypothetical protein KY285_011673 [Solanum tuberosum]|nr:hypothetical protein KY285_011673 [Solanum tuberosum]